MNLELVVIIITSHCESSHTQLLFWDSVPKLALPAELTPELTSDPAVVIIFLILSHLAHTVVLGPVSQIQFPSSSFATVAQS